MLLTRLHLEIVGGILACATVGYAGVTWLQEHDARLKAEATIAANQAKEKDADRREESLKDEIARRDEAAADREAKMLDAVKNLKTPAQIAPFIQHDLAPGSSQPIVVSIPQPTKENPTPNATISLAQADLSVLRDRLSKCDLDADKLNVCQADRVTDADRLRNAGVKLSAVENERDAIALELKGGTFWRRTKTALKYIGITAGATAAAMCGTGHCR
jgi:hypothetical protein